MATVHKSMFPGLFSTGTYSVDTENGQNPHHQGGKPLLPVLKTLVCRGQ